MSTATTSGTAQTVTFSASGLPSGATASFNPTSVTSGGSSTLTISTTSGTAAGTYTVTVTGAATSGSHSATYTLTVNGTGGGCTGAGQKLGNPGFESGGTAWTATSGVIGQYGRSGQPTHSGTWNAWLDGYGTTHTDTLLPGGDDPGRLHALHASFWLHIDTAETTTTTRTTS